MAETFDGVNVNQLNGNLGEGSPSSDGVAILLAVVPVADLPAGVLHNVAIECLQPQDAIDAGFTAAHDANEKLYVLGALTDLFAYAPSAKVYLIPVANALAPDAILATEATKAAIRAAADAKVIGILGTTETAVELAALAEDVQAEIDAFKLEHRLIDSVILQGNNGAGEDAYVVGDLVDLRTKVAPNVSMSIGQDPAVAVLDAVYAKQADIGSVMGMVLVRQVNENLGSVDIINKPRAYRANANYTLTRGSRWASAQLSNGVKMETLSPATQTAITNKGYIFVGSYSGYPGMYFNDSPTAVAANSDYNRIENNRTWNKAARLIRLALLPKVKGVVKKNPTTGFIRSTTIGNWVGLCNKALDAMLNADEISGYTVTIASNQIPNSNTPVVVKASVVKDGIVHTFDVDLSLSNQA